MKNGDAVEVSSVQGEWAWVTFNGVSDWFPLVYLKAPAPAVIPVSPVRPESNVEQPTDVKAASTASPFTVVDVAAAPVKETSGSSSFSPPATPLAPAVTPAAEVNHSYTCLLRLIVKIFIVIEGR